jgi:hypothetical protein
MRLQRIGMCQLKRLKRGRSGKASADIASADLITVAENNQRDAVRNLDIAVNPAQL